MLEKLGKLGLAVLLAVIAVPASAQTWDYYFGVWLGGTPTYQPSTAFAHMSVSTTDSLNFDFTLSAFNPDGDGALSDAFGPNAYISKAVFNTISDGNPLGVSNVETNGFIGNVSLGSGDVYIGGIGFDFFDCFNTGAGLCGFNGGDSGRLQSGEWVSWTLNFATPQLPLLGVPPVAVRVEGFNQDGVTSGWYTPITAVPEPETFAMLLAGLGLMGFVARNRRRNLLV
jgi:hypothetical protein